MITKNSIQYQGTEFLASVLKLPPQNRRDHLLLVEAEDFATPPTREVYRALLTMPELDTAEGFEAADAALWQHLLATGALSGNMHIGIRAAYEDLQKVTPQAWLCSVYARQLRETRYRNALRSFLNLADQNADKLPVAELDEMTRNSGTRLQYLAQRVEGAEALKAVA